MINELYQLSKAIEQAKISVQHAHPKYKEIPNISGKAPCFRLILSEGKITEISTISKDLGGRLRKYGSNQGTYPCCNLAPLYRITDDKIKRKLHDLQAGKLESFDLVEIQSWCTSSNWDRKFLKKYAISMKAVPEELCELLNGNVSYKPILTLMEETAPFVNPKTLYSALEDAALMMLEQKVNVSLALQLLFHAGKSDKDSEDDTGTLSVVFDCERLINEGIPVASNQFTQAFNHVLLEIYANKDDAGTTQDAFGLSFTPLEEPMPSVKLAGGFDVTLRTMFGANHCQTRYGVIDDASYPISRRMRLNLQGALNWLGNTDHKYQTWINTEKDEILFVYPHTLPKTNAAFVRTFKRAPNSEHTFEKEAEKLIADLRGTHSDGSKVHVDRLQVFILRKIDKARTKVLYTRVTDPAELEQRTASWSKGCRNLPNFPFGQPKTLFPMDVADVLNRVWKQDGTLASNKFKPVPYYHGMELLMDAGEVVTQDLSMLVKGCVCLVPFLGNLGISDHKHTQQIWWKVKDMLALCGLLLDRHQLRKENYMEDFPYQYGQLLKVSDELHILYCQVVRNGDVPPQLAGSGLVQAATEAPIRTLNQLGQRMTPYVGWAKSYRYRTSTPNVTAEEKADKADGMPKTSCAGWLLYQYEMIVAKLYGAWSAAVHFSDVEKAQLFLGYLGALPKKDKASEQSTTEQTNEAEENGHD